MRDEKSIEMETRIATIEYFVAQLFRMQYRSMGATDEDILKNHANVRNMFAKGGGIEGSSDPVMLDHFSAESAISANHILEMIEDLIAEDRKKDAGHS